MRISLAKSGRGFSVAPGQSLLDAALAAGLRVPHGCRGGNCGACRASLLQGSVSYPQGPPLGLSAAETAANFVLLCQARAGEDLLLDIDEIAPAGEALVKRLPCRLERTQELSHDMLGVWLRLPAAEEFHFASGQQVDLILTGNRRLRSSIAPPPQASRLLELHVERGPDDELIRRLATTAPGALFTIEGPFDRDG